MDEPNIDRELLLRQAEWIRQDIQRSEEAFDKQRTLVLGALFVLLGWIATKVLSAPEVAGQAFDVVLAKGRRSAEVAFLVCLVAVIHYSFRIWMFSYRAWQFGLQLEFERIGARLGQKWDWGSYIARHQMNKRAGRFSALMRVPWALAPTVGALWFARPAVHTSYVILALWWFTLLLAAVAWIEPRYLFAKRLLEVGPPPAGALPPLAAWLVKRFVVPEKKELDQEDTSGN